MVYNYGRVSLSVSCLSRRRKFIFVHKVYLKRIRASVVNEGHKVKVKVTGAKWFTILIPVIRNKSRSIKHRAMKLACSMGFSDMADPMV